MHIPSKRIILSIVALIFCAITYIACNKDNIPVSTTITKCVTCANGGTCLNDTCRCPTGYEGTSCQTESILKFTQIFDWSVSEDGSVTGLHNPYIINIEQNGSLTSVLINNLYSPYYFSSTVLVANINGDSIFIPSQPIDSGYIIGKGHYGLSSLTGQATITVRYQVTNTTTGVTNDFGYSNPANSPSIWTQD